MFADAKPIEFHLPNLLDDIRDLVKTMSRRPYFRTTRNLLPVVTHRSSPPTHHWARAAVVASGQWQRGKA